MPGARPQHATGRPGPITVRAPAKLNLFLRVLDRRPDGFHELDTVFERIDLADELAFEPAPHVSLTCDDPALSCGEDNLILKAARLLQQASPGAPGARIRLTKRIPVAAGLGGGSSDAAAALTGLNRLWNLRISQDALMPLGARLGSDVPFFLQSSPIAHGVGRGDVLAAVEAGTELAHVLVTPDAQLSTQEVYEGLTEARRRGIGLTTPGPSSRMLIRALRNGSLSELAAALWNDLGPEAIRRCPRISLIEKALRELGCLGVQVSGSGPSVFGLCRDSAHANEVAAQLRTRTVATPWRIAVTRTDVRATVSRDERSAKD
jgi:4-diphosphocytidyl-2-C-methyl-D-erythritol kinase